MTSNFDFLKKYWPTLAEIGTMAETYLYSDPNACIYKLGMFAERLVQEIMIFESIPVPEDDDMHSNRIRLVKRAGLLPYDIDNTLYILRKSRNSAVHTGTDSLDEAKTLLSMTYNLSIWFMQTYGDWSYMPVAFAMPEEVHEKNLQAVIAEQEKKITELSQKLAIITTAASEKSQSERVKHGENVSVKMSRVNAKIF